MMLRYWKWQDICAALVLAAGGFVILLRPGLTLELMARAVGILLIIVGVLFLLAFMLRRGSRVIGYDLILGVLITGLGIFVCLRTVFVVSILPTIFGICIAISGVLKLERGFDLKRMGLDSWGYIIFMSLISILFGTITILNPFGAAKLLMIFIGISFIYSGITDLFTAIYVSWKYSRYMVKGQASEKLEEGTAQSGQAGAEPAGGPDGYYDPYEDGPQAWQGKPVDIWPDMEEGSVNGHDAGPAWPVDYGAREEAPVQPEKTLPDQGTKRKWRLPGRRS